MEVILKSYAQAAVVIFFIVLGARKYSAKVDADIDSKISQSTEDILDPSEILATLEDLEMIVEPKVVLQKGMQNEENFAEKLKELSHLANELEGAFLNTGDNFEMIAHLKKKIIQIKEASSMSISHIEEWDMEMVYYLIIEERMTLEDINALGSPLDINLDKKQWDGILSYSQTTDFKHKIYEYKNIEISSRKKRFNLLGSSENQEAIIQEIWGEE